MFDEKPIYIVMVKYQRACQRIFKSREEAEDYAQKIAVQQKEKTYVLKSILAVTMKFEIRGIYDL